LLLAGIALLKIVGVAFALREYKNIAAHGASFAQHL
jgi:hypothetical protein